MEPVLEVRNVRRKYQVAGEEICAVDGVDLKVEKGDFISIMGPSGSGKTTLLNLIGCIDRPTDGRVLVAGRDTSKMSDAEIDRVRLHHIGFVFQRINLIPILTAMENIELPMELAGMERAARQRRANELLEVVGMSHRANHAPGRLSAGEQQRVGIARAMANRPVIILADEPTGNLDSRNAGIIMDYFKRLNDERKQALVIVTHDPEIGEKARRIRVMRDGRVDFDASS